jgi:hypothetical protein
MIGGSTVKRPLSLPHEWLFCAPAAMGLVQRWAMPPFEDCGRCLRWLVLRSFTAGKMRQRGA